MEKIRLLRTLDLSLYELGWFAFLELIFNTNVTNLSFGTLLLSILSMGTMLLVEPLFLKLFATPPGKWIMGLDIPVYALVREWKSFHECDDGITMEWE